MDVISVVSSLIVLVIMKFNYNVTISHTCWYGLHTGTDCFPASMIDKPPINNIHVAWDESNFTVATICTKFEDDDDIPPVNCIEWDNNNAVICFKREYFPLSVVLALLTALIKLILPILMGIIGVIMNIIGSIIKCCDWPVNDDIPTGETDYAHTMIRIMAISFKFLSFPLIATLIVYTDVQYHWIRRLESEGYGYIEELIVGIAVFIPELLIFPWADFRNDEDNTIFSDRQNKYDPLKNRTNPDED